MHRFFLPLNAFQTGKVAFPPETARQISRVLRLQPGQMVTALDGSGTEFAVRLEEVSPDSTWGTVTGQGVCEAEPAVELVLYLGLTQREKMEWILQKCTEVGVKSVVPVVTSRSLVQDPAEVEHKRQRWETILREAAEQCGRGRIPVLQPCLRFPQALAQASQFENVLFCWEGEHALNLSKAVTGHKKIAVFIGPEGGFSAEEAAAAQAAGWQPVTLGKRVLRMETAAVVACALVLEKVEE